MIQPLAQVEGCQSLALLTLELHSLLITDPDGERADAVREEMFDISHQLPGCLQAVFNNLSGDLYSLSGTEVFIERPPLNENETNYLDYCSRLLNISSSESRIYKLLSWTLIEVPERAALALHIPFKEYELLDFLHMIRFRPFRELWPEQAVAAIRADHWSKLGFPEVAKAFSSWQEKNK